MIKGVSELKQLTIRETNIFFMLFMILYFGLSVIAGTFLPESTPVWLSMCISDAIILFPVVLLLFYKKIMPWQIPELSPIGLSDLILACIAAYCLMPMIYFINYITAFFAKNYVNGMVSNIYGYPLWVQLLLIAVIPAIVEEFIFRGLFYGSYRRRNVICAALMSGLLFGLAHLNLNQFAYAFIMGIAFCLLYEVSGNILLPVISHFAINANTIFMVYFSTVDMEQLADVSTENVIREIPVGVMAVVLTFLFVMGLFGIGLFSLILRKIANRHGRLLRMKDAFREYRIYKEETEGHIWDGYMTVTVCCLVLYMILIELI